MNTKLSISSIETIKKRQSLRTHKDEMFSDSDRKNSLNI